KPADVPAALLIETQSNANPDRGRTVREVATLLRRSGVELNGPANASTRPRRGLPSQSEHQGFPGTRHISTARVMTAPSEFRPVDPEFPSPAPSSCPVRRGPAS